MRRSATSNPTPQFLGRTPAHTFPSRQDCTVLYLGIVKNEFPFLNSVSWYEVLPAPKYR